MPGSSRTTRTRRRAGNRHGVGGRHLERDRHLPGDRVGRGRQPDNPTDDRGTGNLVANGRYDDLHLRPLPQPAGSSPEGMVTATTADPGVTSGCGCRRPGASKPPVTMRTFVYWPTTAGEIDGLDDGQRRIGGELDRAHVVGRDLGTGRKITYDLENSDSSVGRREHQQHDADRGQRQQGADRDAHPRSRRRPEAGPGATAPVRNASARVVFTDSATLHPLTCTHRQSTCGSAAVTRQINRPRP